MNPQCSRCNKTVYPVEKLSCLDKYWHKGCFKCTHCDLTLNMKNYKGYNKMPYCSAHYPTQKFTTITDTPENKRLAQLTQNFSNINYHKQFNEDRNNFKSYENSNPSPRFDNNENIADDNGKQNEQAPRVTKINARQVLPQSPVQRAPSQVAPEKAKYRCLYDYFATDNDEVSFMEGDIIINGEVIDPGWMTGTVERTGNHGMLPYNYVEEI